MHATWIDMRQWLPPLIFTGRKGLEPCANRISLEWWGLRADHLHGGFVRRRCLCICYLWQIFLFVLSVRVVVSISIFLFLSCNIIVVCSAALKLTRLFTACWYLRGESSLLKRLLVCLSYISIWVYNRELIISIIEYNPLFFLILGIHALWFLTNLLVWSSFPLWDFSEFCRCMLCMDVVLLFKPLYKVSRWT